MSIINQGEAREHQVVVSIVGGLFIVRRRCTGGKPPTRGAVTGFSQSSAGRMRRYLRSCRAEYRTMLTLTYPGCYPTDGRQCKEHLRRFIQELRRYTERNERRTASLWSVFWFLEFQHRGAPHFHLFSSHDYPKEWVARTWWNIVGTEDERHLRAGTRVESIRGGRAGILAYALKYAAKAEQKDVPADFEGCGRFWGVWGMREAVAAATLVNLSHPDAGRARSTLKSLQEFINRRVLEGRAKVLVKNGYTVGVLLSDLGDQLFVKKRIIEISIAYSAYCGRGRLLVPYAADEEGG